MSDSPCTDALIEFRKSIRRKWDEVIDGEINRAFHHGYAAGMASGDPPPATRDLLYEVREYLACRSTLYNVEQKLEAFETEWKNRK